MQFKVARGAMMMIANMGKVGQLDMVGISRDDFEKVSGETVWLGTDRNRVSQVLNNLLCGALDVIGVPRFQLPAEYIAAGIALFVAPVNSHAACRFMEKVPTAQALGRGADESEMCTARQLFALVTQLVADPMNSHAKVLFEKNTGLALERKEKEILKKGVDGDGKKKS